jgi:RNA ligase
MTLLKDILSFDLLQQMLAEGYIRQQIHPVYPELMILNYTQNAQFERVWNDATNICRGLIVVLPHRQNELTEDSRVLARPFAKFFNLNTEFIPQTMEVNLPADIPLVTEKLDGSMGVCFWYDGKPWIATRGSFDSEQARWATEWIRIKLASDWMRSTSFRTEFIHLTPVFEIIYKENRIVVDYKFEELQLIGVINIATGLELPRHELEVFAQKLGVTPVKKFNKSLAECAGENNPNEEGYVLTYANGLKVKIKFEEYLRLHRILTGLNPRAIWEMLAAKQDKSVDTILADPTMPVAFKEWFGGWVNQLRSKYADIERQVQLVFEQRPKADADLEPQYNRKKAALYFLKHPDVKSVLFAMLDEKDYSEIIWGQIQPKGNETFKPEI